MSYFLGLFLLISVALAADITKCPKPRVRKAWRSLSSDERNKYLAAIAMLEPMTFAEQFGFRHLEWDHVNHGSPHFLPYHRVFIYEYEDYLRSLTQECITIPYFDHSADANTPEEAVALRMENLGPLSGEDKDGEEPMWVKTGILKDWSFDGYTQEQWDEMRTKHEESKHKYGHTRKFASWQVKYYTKGKHQCLKRGNHGTNRNRGWPTNGNTWFALMGAGKVGFDRVRQHIEGGPHGGVHNYMGGDMRSMRSPVDPLFFSHHAFIDLLWQLWQDCAGHDNKASKEIIKAGVTKTIDPKAKAAADMIWSEDSANRPAWEKEKGEEFFRGHHIYKLNDGPMIGLNDKVRAWEVVNPIEYKDGVVYEIHAELEQAQQTKDLIAQCDMHWMLTQAESKANKEKRDKEIAELKRMAEEKEKAALEAKAKADKLIKEQEAEAEKLRLQKEADEKQAKELQRQADINEKKIPEVDKRSDGAEKAATVATETTVEKNDGQMKEKSFVDRVSSWWNRLWGGSLLDLKERRRARAQQKTTTATAAAAARLTASGDEKKKTTSSETEKKGAKSSESESEKKKKTSGSTDGTTVSTPETPAGRAKQYQKILTAITARTPEVIGSEQFVPQKGLIAKCDEEIADTPPNSGKSCKKIDSREDCINPFEALGTVCIWIQVDETKMGCRRETSYDLSNRAYIAARSSGKTVEEAHDLAQKLECVLNPGQAVEPEEWNEFLEVNYLVISEETKKEALAAKMKLEDLKGSDPVELMTECEKLMTDGGATKNLTPEQAEDKAKKLKVDLNKFLVDGKFNEAELTQLAKLLGGGGSTDGGGSTAAPPGPPPKQRA